MGCSPWGRKESDTTERLHFHFSLSCIGEGNGNPLQCSCLENPRDGGAWWAAVYGVTQSQTRLKRLSSSDSLYPSTGTRSYLILLILQSLSLTLPGCSLRYQMQPQCECGPVWHAGSFSLVQFHGNHFIQGRRGLQQCGVGDSAKTLDSTSLSAAL